MRALSSSPVVHTVLAGLALVCGTALFVALFAGIPFLAALLESPSPSTERDVELALGALSLSADRYGSSPVIHAAGERHLVCADSRAD